MIIGFLTMHEWNLLRIGRLIVVNDYHQSDKILINKFTPVTD